MALKYALYMAVNKNTDELYTEVVEYDEDAASYYLTRMMQVIESPEPPEGISKDPTWWECKFCDHYDVCHGGQLPNKNCRTCINSTPVDDGKWHCNKHDTILSRNDEMKACEYHLNFPHFVEADLIATDGDTMTYSNGFVDGKKA